MCLQIKRAKGKGKRAKAKEEIKRVKCRKVGKSKVTLEDKRQKEKDKSRKTVKGQKSIGDIAVRAALVDLILDQS